MCQLRCKQSWTGNKYLLIALFCVVYLKTVICTFEYHGLQKENDLSLNLTHQLFREKRDNYDNSDNDVSDYGDEEDGDEEGNEEIENTENIQEYSGRNTRQRHQASRHVHHSSQQRHQNDHRRYNNNNNNRRSRGKKHRTEKTSVTMPSGRKYYITKPNMSKWRCNTPSTPTKLITLNPTGKMGKKEYDMVSQEMKAAVPAGTIMNYQIVKIEKVVNGCLWRRYRNRQDIVYGEAHKVNERMLFHGSRKMTEILQSGFDERYAVIAGAFGPGIYFSPRSSTSNIFTGAGPGVEGKMLLCRVTVGKLYKAPTYPDRHSHAPPSYHSVGGGEAIGDLNNEVIVYRGEQAYGEYLITYKF